MKNQPNAPEQGQNKTFLYLMLGFTAFFILCFVAIVLFIHGVVSKANGGGQTALFSGSGDSIDLIEIAGPITDSDDVVKRIRRFKKNGEKALIIRLNSPGGAVAPSQEIYSEILSARADKKIVVASMSSLAASGAYYIASACDKIVADPGTLTGSVETLLALWTEIGESVARAGVRRLVIVNSHGGQPQLVDMVCRRLRGRARMFAVACMWSRLGIPDGLATLGLGLIG